MALEHSQVIALLKEVYLFAGYDEAALAQATLLFTQVQPPPDTVLATVDKYADGFYIVAQGEVVLTYLERANDDLVDVLVRGDFFGAEALMVGRPNRYTAVTSGTTILLKAEPAQFNDLLVQFPNIQVNIQRIAQSQELIRTHDFPWLNEDEVVYQARRKHEAFLVIMLLWPAFAVLLFLLLALGAVMLLDAESRLLVLTLSGLGILTIIGLLWMVWNYLDWSNDYYIVTNQRVVWVEHVIGLYESRVEAPHGTIQAVNNNSDLLGRLLGYGNVTVSTFTGQVILYHVGEPYLMAALIQEQWHRSSRIIEKTKKEDLDQSVRRIVKPSETRVTTPAPGPTIDAKLDDYQEPDFARNYLSGLLVMRFQQGSTITYRKHWIMLLRKAWKPTLIGLTLFAGMAGCVGAYWLRDINFINPLIVVLVVSLLLAFIILPWWLYNYVDWRNDIYQLTEKNIFDIKRKPLGTESRKSASLERVLSLRHDRPGFIGYILNVGNVVINFGDTDMIFEGVFEPARVQQEIFSRMHQLRQQLQRDEVAREREAILAVVESYHRLINEENP